MSSTSLVTDVRVTILDKEMLTSQMRKLNLENSALQMENKLLKDKNNRAAVRVTELETKLQKSQEEIYEIQLKRDQESGRALLTARLEMEREIEQYQTKATSAAKQVDLLKSEISYLDEQLITLQRELEVTRQAADRSKIYETHQQEVETFRNEIENLKSLLEQTDHSLEKEISKCVDLTNQVHRLTEENQILRSQLEGDNDDVSVAEKQITSLLLRLHVTEERLSQERADRAGNLSQIEEKLLTDNAKLQTKSKELDRQLKREKEKTKVLEQRLKEFREENLHLRLSVPDEDEQSYDLPYIRQSRADTKKHGNDLTNILHELVKESGLSLEEEGPDGLLLYLWQERQLLQQNVKAWRICLDQWKKELDQNGHSVEEDSFENLQMALSITRESESRMLKTEENYEDINAEKISSEQVYRQQLSELVKDKHSTHARLDTLQDLMDALRAENEILRQGLAMTSGQKDVKPKETESKEDVLLGEITSLESKLAQVMRKNKVLTSELTTLRSQLSLRDSELKETIAEYKLTQSVSPSQQADEKVKGHHLQALQEEVAGYKEEIRCLNDRQSVTLAERQKLELELSEVKGQLRSLQAEYRQLEAGKTQNGDVNSFEEEIEKKTVQILQLTSQLTEAEINLSQVRNELGHQRQTHQDIVSQMDQLRSQLDQRCQMLDQISLRETDQLEQLEMVKSMLQTLTQGLTSKEGEVEILTLKLQQSQDKVLALEEQIAAAQGKVQVKGEGHKLSSAAKENLRHKELQELKTQVLQAVTSANTSKLECTELTQEVNKLRLELSTVMSSNVQLVNEKGLLERKIQILEEENNLVQTELDVGQTSLNQLESSLQEVVEKIGGQISHFEPGNEENMVEVDQKVLLNKLQTLQLNELAREKENEVIVEKIRRQEQEKITMSKHCDILQQEVNQCHQDVSRITKELVMKMKENAATTEINRMLQKDHLSLQKKLATLETKVEEKSVMADKQKAEVIEVIKQMEMVEQKQDSTLSTIQQRESTLVDYEKQIQQLSLNLTHMEKLRDEMQAGIDHLTEEVTSLKNVISVLEHKVQERDSNIHELKAKCHKQKEEILSLTHTAELANQEQDVLVANINSDKKVLETLKEEIKVHEENEKKLSDKVAQLTGELEVQRSHLIVAKETIQQTKAEKEIFMKDYQDVCRRLGEKENIHKETEKKIEAESALVREESQRQKEMFLDLRAASEKEINQLRQENELLKQQLQIKNEEISKNMEKFKELEEIQRINKSLEVSIQEKEVRSGQSNMLVDSLRKEVMSLREENSQLQDTVARKVVSILDLQDQLRSSSEMKETQAIDMKHTMEGMRAHHEYERKTWKESLNKVEESARNSAEEVSRLTAKCDQISEQLQSKEKILVELNLKLKENMASQKHLEDKILHLKESLEEMKQKKISLENSLHSTQSECTSFKERIMSLTNQIKDKESALNISQKAVRLGEEKIEFLSSELLRHQRLLDSHKQQSTAKLQQLRSQAETESKDQIKVQQQAHVLSVELEQVRETLTLKNKESLKLQETVLELEQRVREYEIKLRLGEEMQTKLGYRFEEQENEVKKLRNFLSKKAEEDGSGKTMWQEMNRVMSELSHQLQFHFETSRSMDHGGREEDELVYKLRKQLLETESQLNTERALHQITKGSMQSLEEDCNRLRQTIMAMRKRAISSEKKQKSRMEEINEIIARSQTRAQALLSSGDYSLDTSFRSLNPSRDYNLADVSFSSDTSLASDAHLANLSFLNLSSTYPGLSPRK
nr:putative leucine-rich repeat-containing protein DDisoform X1 [Biomphalaria glabrata]